MVYWNANNTFSIAQSLMLKSKFVKKMFDIPTPPAYVAPAPDPVNVPLHEHLQSQNPPKIELTNKK